MRLPEVVGFLRNASTALAIFLPREVKLILRCWICEA
jgi:hypothetical protein